MPHVRVKKPSKRQEETSSICCCQYATDTDTYTTWSIPPPSLARVIEHFFFFNETRQDPCKHTKPKHHRREKRREWIVCATWRDWIVERVNATYLSLGVYPIMQHASQPTFLSLSSLCRLFVMQTLFFLLLLHSFILPFSLFPFPHSSTLLFELCSLSKHNNNNKTKQNNNYSSTLTHTKHIAPTLVNYDQAAPQKKPQTSQRNLILIALVPLDYVTWKDLFWTNIGGWGRTGCVHFKSMQVYGSNVWMFFFFCG